MGPLFSLTGSFCLWSVVTAAVLLETATTSSFPAFPSLGYTLNLRHKHANGNFSLQLEISPRHINAVDGIAWENNADNDNYQLVHIRD